MRLRGRRRAELTSTWPADFRLEDASESPVTVLGVYACRRLIDELTTSYWDAGGYRGGPERAGVLLGHALPALKAAPPLRASGTIVVTDIEPVTVDAASADHATGPSHAFLDAFGRGRERGLGLHLLGWWHTHPGHGVFLSQPDRVTHQALFRHAYQVAMVVDPSTWQAGVFAREASSTLPRSEMLGTPFDLRDVVRGGRTGVR